MTSVDLFLCVVVRMCPEAQERPCDTKIGAACSELTVGECVVELLVLVAGRYAWRGSARKGRYGWSQNLTYGTRGYQNYFNFHVSHRTRWW